MWFTQNRDQLAAERHQDTMRSLAFIIRRIAVMSTELDNLTASVANLTGATGSAVVLLQVLKTKLDAALANVTDGPALQALSDQLTAAQAALAAALTENAPN